MTVYLVEVSHIYAIILVEADSEEEAIDNAHEEWSAPEILWDDAEYSAKEVKE